MERALVHVEPDGSAWQVRLAGQSIVTGLDVAMAIFQASHLAAQRHQATGLPTGVQLRTLDGQELLLRGWELGV